MFNSLLRNILFFFFLDFGFDHSARYIVHIKEIFNHEENIDSYRNKIFILLKYHSEINFYLNLFILILNTDFILRILLLINLPWYQKILI